MIHKKIYKKQKMSYMVVIGLIIFIFATISVTAMEEWYDGGFSSDPNHPRYGQHDFILQKAIDMLPPETKQKIDIIPMYYGTELPDCITGIYCINDQYNHNVYYYANGNIQRDRSAIRSKQEYNLAQSYLQNGDRYNFSLRIGTMGHYISDLSVFAHTMGYGTHWGSAVHEAEYEQYAERHLDLWDTHFDGKFERISAYDAALRMAKETTFDNGIYTNVWMDRNYNWSNPNFVSRTRYLINYNVNILTDVIYTMADTYPPASISNLQIRNNHEHGSITWKDPKDIDFAKVTIYINGKFDKNISNGVQYYSIEIENHDDHDHRSIEIGTRTVDVNGNSNRTWVNKTYIIGED